MMSGMTCKPGDIVGLPFPFSDLTSQKKRPVLVLTQADFRGDFMGLAIMRMCFGMSSRASVNTSDATTSIFESPGTLPSAFGNV
jgi:hypothetical protein